MRRHTKPFTLAAGGGSLLVATTGAGIALAPTAGATTFTVVNTLDSGAGSLRQAILDANANPGADTIDFAPSAYGNIALSGSGLTITESATIDGPGMDILTITGDGSDHVFDINQSNADSTTISGMTVTGGTGLIVGGGIIGRRGTLVIDGVSSTGNTSVAASSFAGAGVTMLGSADTDLLTILNSEITDNTAAQATIGGGVLALGASLEISDSVISGNTAGVGGGVVASSYISRVDHISISDSAISGNTSTSFGAAGILLYGGTITVANTSIDSNLGGPASGSGPDSEGGGAVVIARESATITDSAITNNVSAYGASGLRVQGRSATLGDSPILTMSRITVAGNSTTASSPAGSLVISGLGFVDDSTVTQNDDDGIVVDVSVDSAINLVVVANSTIADNTGIGLTQAPNTPANLMGISHTIIAGNDGGDLGADCLADWSLIEDPGSVFLTGSNNITGVDPELQPFSMLTTLLGVRPILKTSPAWNAGNPAFEPPPSVDQRGLPRVVTIIDIGAFELQEDPPSPTTTTPGSDPVVPVFAG